MPACRSNNGQLARLLFWMSIRRAIIGELGTRDARAWRPLPHRLIAASAFVLILLTSPLMLKARFRAIRAACDTRGAFLCIPRAIFAISAPCAFAATRETCPVALLSGRGALGKFRVLATVYSQPSDLA